MTSNPLTSMQAAFYRLSAVQAGRQPADMMSEHTREMVEKAAAASGKSTSQIVDEAADAGDDKDRRIALLEAHILLASDRLSAWLTDNTKDAFEEQHDIDDVRATLLEGVI